MRGPLERVVPHRPTGRSVENRGHEQNRGVLGERVDNVVFLDRSTVPTLDHDVSFVRIDTTLAHLRPDGVVVGREVEFVDGHFAALVERREKRVDVRRRGVRNDDLILFRAQQGSESVVESFPVVKPVRVRVRPPPDARLAPLLYRARQRQACVVRKRSERVAVHVQLAVRNAESVAQVRERIGIVPASGVVLTDIHIARSDHSHLTLLTRASVRPAVRGNRRPTPGAN
nr:hypothetical protein [Haladaptatus halobius]